MGYYKDRNDVIYRKLSVAEQAETGEKMVVFQEMYGNGRVLVLPESLFLDEQRFVRITDDEAEKRIPLALNPRYHFPELQYEDRMPDLTEADEISKTVRAMMTLLLNRHIVKGDFFNGITKDDDLEKLALEKIRRYSEGDDLEQIFHLIQTWGGSSGRGIYVYGEGFSWEKIAEKYQDLVNTCLSVTNIEHDSIGMLLKAINKFNIEVHNLGISFITKHTRFWLVRNLGNNALPIYDSIMARFVMFRTSAEMKHLEEYWNVMIAKSEQLGIGLMPLERQIFKYASSHIQ